MPRPEKKFLENEPEDELYDLISWDLPGYRDLRKRRNAHRHHGGDGLTRIPSKS
ncbi:MAG TPA: hypothetical protein VFO27_04775 [Bryobacteraceae bacterium]|nr:hypothetical protein [Bryobacteraceae bacterium]